ncbi:MAG: hypothetical protein HN995_13555 [Candidatus Marinimicrobia bacterium]|jgi:hypothetical protein|nr:hypothetical protein [Candidatus Neomarinimicrobiota bacterium]MBT3952157.1 hypothetical protein [Candidatus Neomarinimicrobiota bacterium]MBT4252233.1 hypothetical protein [Candidatus Neomarinimicrobiota bacterium]MBT6948201.1 hypothetical protein [Candidatus Neomarinimicrobiota bacterium]
MFEPFKRCLGGISGSGHRSVEFPFMQRLSYETSTIIILTNIPRVRYEPSDFYRLIIDLGNADTIATLYHVTHGEDLFDIVEEFFHSTSFQVRYDVVQSHIEIFDQKLFLIDRYNQTDSSMFVSINGTASNAFSFVPSHEVVQHNKYEFPLDENGKTVYRFLNDFTGSYSSAGNTNGEINYNKDFTWSYQGDSLYIDGGSYSLQKKRFKLNPDKSLLSTEQSNIKCYNFESTIVYPMEMDSLECIAETEFSFGMDPGTYVSAYDVYVDKWVRAE